MPLDPQVAELLELVNKFPGAEAGSVEDARQRLERMASADANREPVDRIEERTIAGPGGDIRLRIYRPAAASALPVLVFFHGGGWVIGSLDTHDQTCRQLANWAGCVVVSVDYRLAPEHKFPAAVEDAYAATRWASENAAGIGGDPARLAVGGDSAGGNLAAVTCLMAREKGGPGIAFQLLMYPGTDFVFDDESCRANGEGLFLTVAEMRWFSGHYLRDASDADDPRCSPMRAKNLSGLPPALVITAEFDPLRDQGDAYAARLAEAGVDVTAISYPGLVHGFFGMTSMVAAARAAMDQTAAHIRRALAEKETARA